MNLQRITSIISLLTLLVVFSCSSGIEENFINDLSVSLGEAQTLTDSIEVLNSFVLLSKMSSHKKSLSSDIKEEIKINLNNLKNRKTNLEKITAVRKIWNRAKNNDSLDAYKKFLTECSELFGGVNNCPTEYKQQAQQRIIDLKEEKRQQAELNAEREKNKRENLKRERTKTAYLKLINLKCLTKEDVTEKDNIYIKINGKVVLDNRRMDSGYDLTLLNIGLVKFENNTIEVEVYDDDSGDLFGGDDLLLKLRAKKSDLGKDLSPKVGRHFGAHYELKYAVVRK